MSDTEKKAILSSIDQQIDAMPEKTLIWLDGFVHGTIKATAEQKHAEEQKGA